VAKESRPVRFTVSSERTAVKHLVSALQSISEHDVATRQQKHGPHAEDMSCAAFTVHRHPVCRRRVRSLHDSGSYQAYGYHVCVQYWPIGAMVSRKYRARNSASRSRATRGGFDYSHSAQRNRCNLGPITWDGSVSTRSAGCMLCSRRSSRALAWLKAGVSDRPGRHLG
jgi:hypothetical protein